MMICIWIKTYMFIDQYAFRKKVVLNRIISNSLTEIIGV